MNGTVVEAFAPAYRNGLRAGARVMIPPNLEMMAGRWGRRR